MNVLLSVPNTGWIHKMVVLSVIRLLQDPRHETTYIQPTLTPLENSLNHIAFDLLQGDWDYWLSIDADNPPTRNPLDLIDFNLDVCGCPTPIFNNAGEGYPVCWNAMDAVPDGYMQHPPEPGKLAEVDAIGNGCMLVHRRVIEGVSPPWFVREIDQFGRVVRGHDFGFCDKARAAGFRIWAHYGYPCRHYNELDLIEAMEAFGDKPGKSSLPGSRPSGRENI